MEALYTWLSIILLSYSQARDNSICDNQVVTYINLLKLEENIFSYHLKLLFTAAMVSLNHTTLGEAIAILKNRLPVAPLKI